jgi:hypothetical protein
VLKAVVDDIHQKYDSLFEFVKLDFLFDKNQSKANQSSSSNANASAKSVPHDEPDISVDYSFEISLRAYFHKIFPNNRIFKCATGDQLELISKSHFHEAILQILDIKTMFKEEVEEDRGRGLISTLFDYLSSEERQISDPDGTSILNIGGVVKNEHDESRFDLYRSVYDKAKLQYPILRTNAIEYVSLKWLKEEDKDPNNYRSGPIDYWNRLVYQVVNDTWNNVRSSDKLKMLMNKDYLGLYKVHYESAVPWYVRQSR